MWHMKNPKFTNKSPGNTQAARCPRGHSESAHALTQGSRHHGHPIPPGPTPPLAWDRNAADDAHALSVISKIKWATLCGSAFHFKVLTRVMSFGICLIGSVVCHRAFRHRWNELMLKSTPLRRSLFHGRALPPARFVSPRVHLYNLFRFFSLVSKMKPTGWPRRPRNHQRDHKNEIRDGIRKNIRKILKSGGPATSRIIIFRKNAYEIH